MAGTGLNGYVYGSSVDFNTSDVNDILGIYEY